MWGIYTELNKMLEKDGDIYYMRVCNRCKEFFFVTARNCSICEKCQHPNYKKHFWNRGIKYIDYNSKSRLLIKERGNLT